MIEKEIFRPPRIVVAGVGGGGCNAVGRMIQVGIPGVSYIACNTDCQALQCSEASTKVQIGPFCTRGLGAGGQMEAGLAAAEESHAEIARALQGADLVFVTAGLGGGTGSGAASVVAEIARQQGAMTVAVVTLPFTFEGKRRQATAQAALERLRTAVDTLIVVPNDRLLKLVDAKVTLDLAFRIADDVLRQGVQGVAELVTQSGLINLSFANLKAILGLRGGAFFSVGYGRGPDRAAQAVRTALSHSLLEINTLNAANGVLVHVTVGPQATLSEVTQVVGEITRVAGPEAEVSFGATIDAQMDDAIQIILVMTGVGGPPTADHRPPTNDHQAPSTEQRATSNDHQRLADDAIAYVLPEPAYAGAGSAVRDALDIPAFLRRRQT